MSQFNQTLNVMEEHPNICSNCSKKQGCKDLLSSGSFQGSKILNRIMHDSFVATYGDRIILGGV